MKKIFLLTLIITMLLISLIVLTGCGDKKETNNTENKTITNSDSKNNEKPTTENVKTLVENLLKSVGEKSAQENVIYLKDIESNLPEGWKLLDAMYTPTPKASIGGMPKVPIDSRPSETYLNGNIFDILDHATYSFIILHEESGDQYYIMLKDNATTYKEITIKEVRELKDNK